MSCLDLVAGDGVVVVGLLLCLLLLVVLVRLLFLLLLLLSEETEEEDEEDAEVGTCAGRAEAEAEAATLCGVTTGLLGLPIQTAPDASK